MKITKSELKELIKESLNENYYEDQINIVIKELEENKDEFILPSIKIKYGNAESKWLNISKENLYALRDLMKKQK